MATATGQGASGSSGSSSSDSESDDDIFEDPARDVRELKVAQLKTQLAKFKLSTSGKKAELIKRLLDHGWSGGGTTAAEHGCVPSMTL